MVNASLKRHFTTFLPKLKLMKTRKNATLRVTQVEQDPMSSFHCLFLAPCACMYIIVHTCSRCTHVHTHTHTYAHPLTHIHPHILSHTRLYARIHRHLQTHTYTFTETHMRTPFPHTQTHTHSLKLLPYNLLKGSGMQTKPFLPVEDDW